MSSASIFFLVIASSVFLQCMSQEKQIHLQGTPEADYPTYYTIPKTSFRCSDQLYNPGMYADTETRCQVFHYCYEHRKQSFLCPLGTVFNQPLLACDYWYSSDCSTAPSHYNVNAMKRSETFSDEADDISTTDPLYVPSENVFDKMAELYEINKTLESPDLKKDLVSLENKSASKDTIESSSESLVGKDIKTEDYNKYSYDKHSNMVDEKQPEIVKYELIGLNAVNIHEDSKNEQSYEVDNVKDFIFSDDGKLHISEDVDQVYPTDMNFDQGYSSHSKTPSEQNFNNDLYEGLDYDNDFQIPDFELQKRYYDLSGSKVRRPLNRKPIIIIPEVEPEIVQLPVAKPKRKPIGIHSIVGTIADKESSEEATSVFNNNKEETVSVANQGFDVASSGEFPIDESNLELNYKFIDPKLVYEFPEETGDENGPQLFQMDSSSEIYDSSKQNTRTAYFLPNEEDEFSSTIFGSGSDDLALSSSKYGDESELFTESVKRSIGLPDESSDTTIDNEIIDSEEYLGSGSEETIRDPSSDELSSFDHQHIFSDDEDGDIADMEASHVQQLNLSNNSDQKNTDMPDFVEQDNDPTRYILNYDYEGNFEYGEEQTFSTETLGKLTPSKNSENDEMTVLDSEGSGLSEFHYLPQELQESLNYPQNGEEIRETDGEYYVFSDSEFSNHDYDSNGLYSEHSNYAEAENYEEVLDEASEDLIDSERYLYVPEESKSKIDYMESETLHILGHQDSSPLEDGYEKLLDEFETVTSSDVSEEHTVDDSETEKEFLTEDLKYLEVMSQTPIPILKNLFDVSEKSSSHDMKDEIPHFKVTPPEQDINDQIVEDLVNMEGLEYDSLLSGVSSEPEGNFFDIESSDIHSETLATEEASDKNGLDQHSTEYFLPEKIEKESLGKDNSGQNGTVFSLHKQPILEDKLSNMDGLDQDGTKIFLPEKNMKDFVSGKETDPLNDLIVGSDEALDILQTKQKLPSTELLNPKVSQSLIMQKDKKKHSREKRFSENVLTFNSPSKPNPFIAKPRKETFREAVFTNIPSTFLKMKHSTLSPYFYNYGLKNSGFNPRTGDSFESSKLSKLSSIGRSILAAKSRKFNLVKNYVDSYRNI